MAEAFIVDVDLERMRTHRSRAEHRQLSEGDVRLLLIRSGFYPRIDGLYLAEEAVLQQLDPSEIIAARRVSSLQQQ
jgi:hypothetical protein